MATRMVDQGAALAGLVLLGVAAAFSAGAAPLVKVLLAAGGATVAALSLLAGAGGGAPVVLVTALLVLAGAGRVPWQAAMPLALFVWSLAAKLAPSLRTPGWRQPGHVPWRGTLLCAAVTPFALVAWVVLMTPDIDDLLRGIPRVPAALLVAGALLFTFVNAAGEELIWRGLLQQRLSLLFGPVAAIGIQGVSFGVQHAQGFPRGLVGMVLAGVWGIMLGWLRRRSGGILAPLLAHLVADATIAAIVLAMLRQG